MSATSRRGFLRGALALPAIAAVPAIAQADSGIGEGRAIFKIGGESVLVDTTDISMGSGSLAVVIDKTGAMCLAEAINHYDNEGGRSRHGLGPSKAAPAWGRTAHTREVFIIIGKVVAPTQPARLAG